MGRHNQKTKQQQNKKRIENTSVNLYNFFDTSFATMISIFSGKPPGNKKHYRVYKK
jgi:hypothetical protein